jgi:PAS domain S-box-containing protein
MTKIPSSITLRITLVYALAAGTWIFISDRVLEALAPAPHWLATAQTYKGWLFVAVTASLLYVVLRHQLITLERTQAARDRYAQRMETLHAIDQSIIEARSLQQIADTTLKQMRQIVPCQHASITIIDLSSNESLGFSADLNHDSAIRSGLHISSAPGWIAALSAGQMIVVDDLQRLPEPDYPLRRQLAEEGMHSSIAAPLILHGQLIGSLNLAAVTPGYFTAEYQEIISEIAAQLAITIQQTRLTEQITQHARDLEQHITELRQTEQALRESEAHYRSTLDNMLEGCQIIGCDWRYLYLNDSAVRYGRQPKDDLLGHTVMERYPGIADTEMFATLRRCMDERTTRFEEFEFIYPDGDKAWFEFSIQPVPEGIFILTIDITERKRARLAEHEQRVWAEALADTAAALNSALELKDVMNTILENVARVVPHDAANIMLIEDHLAHPVYWRGYPAELVPLLDEFRIPLMETPNLHQMFVSGQPFVVPYTAQYPDWVHQPLTAWVHSYVAAPIRSHGRVIGFLNLDSAVPGFFTEAHAQRLQVFADQASIAIEHAQLYEEIRRYAGELERRVEERTAQLHHTKDRIETILNSSSDVIILCRTDGLIDQVNPAFEKTFQCEPDTFFLQPLINLVSPQHVSMLEQAFQTVVDTRQPKRVELTVHCNQRLTFDADMVLSPIVQDDDRLAGVVCSLRDITVQKQMEARLRQMLQREMKLSELKSAYVSMAAHDLRNPLAVIQSAVDLIRQYSDRLTEEQIQRKYDRMQDSIKVMVDMLDDILIIGQVESGKLTFNPAPVEVISFCQNIAAEAKQAAGAAQPIDFSYQGECGTAQVDVKLLRHILSNLLSNAIKYSPEGSPVTFTASCEPDQITFRIQDRGIGIPQADQSRLFEAFHRAENVGNVPGTGLGLAIVKQSVELHGGTITFESEEGVGSTFTVILPQPP